MAKGRSSRGNAISSSPPSLAKLLALPKTPTAIPFTPNQTFPLDNPLLTDSIERRQYVRSLEDRRLNSPLSRINRPAIASVRSATRLVSHPLRSFTTAVGNRAPEGIRFYLPDRVAICVRRKIRREVVHALRVKPKHGRGGGKRRRTPYSGIKC